MSTDKPTKKEMEIMAYNLHTQGFNNYSEMLYKFIANSDLLLAAAREVAAQIDPTINPDEYPNITMDRKSIKKLAALLPDDR